MTTRTASQKKYVSFDIVSGFHMRGLYHGAISPHQLETIKHGKDTACGCCATSPLTRSVTT